MFSFALNFWGKILIIGEEANRLQSVQIQLIVYHHLYNYAMYLYYSPSASVRP